MPDQTVEVREDVFTVPGLYIASVVLQPNLNDNATNVTVTGIPDVQNVRRVFLQVRQSTTDTTFPDQFSTQVIRMDQDSFVFRIMRLDSGGWMGAAPTCPDPARRPRRRRLIVGSRLTVVSRSWPAEGLWLRPSAARPLASGQG